MKRDVSSVYFGIIVGLSLGFVLCNVVHAETTGIVAEPTDRVLGSVYPIGPPIRSCEVFSGQKWCRHNYDTEDIGGDDIRLSCLATMEAAMRAMEPHIDPNPSYWYETYDGCNTCAGVIGGTFTCSLLACTSGGNEVARLEWELKQARKKEEAAKQRAVAAKQWEQAKACWRKP